VLYPSCVVTSWQERWNQVWRIDATPLHIGKLSTWRDLEAKTRTLRGYRVSTCLTRCILVLQGVCLSRRLSYAAWWAVLYGPMPGDCKGGGEGCWTRGAGSAAAGAAVIGSLDEVWSPQVCAVHVQKQKLSHNMAHMHLSSDCLRTS
jgi:hypothetical protein